MRIAIQSPMPQTPYSTALGNHEALASLAEMHAAYTRVLSSIDAAIWEQPLAPGKWTVAQLLTHLLHTELAFCLRVRMIVTTDTYQVQPFDQDAWMSREMHHAGPAAFAAWTSLRAVNVAYFTGLSADERSRGARHPEYGEISAQWVIEALAGHDRHHWPQLTKALGIA